MITITAGRWLAVQGITVDSRDVFFELAPPGFWRQSGGLSPEVRRPKKPPFSRALTSRGRRRSAHGISGGPRSTARLAEREEEVEEGRKRTQKNRK
jgi:hypothetical protein